MPRRTKIICTMGPAVFGVEKIIQLIDAGMNVARINFSHGTQEEHLKVIQDLKRAREERKVPLAIMLDTKGPEIRIGKVKGGQISVQTGQRLWLVKETVEGDEKRVSVTPPVVLDNVSEGTTILIDDGYITSKVVEKNREGVLIEIENSGLIKTQKGVNIPGIHLDLPAMTQQDISDITFGCEQDIDLIAASFIRSPEHVLEIKRLLAERGKGDISVISKIENRLGVENFDSILQVSDGIMVARGDLGVEVPLKEVPALQKMMIRKCYLACKPVITATQMLESMIKNPRPTRAEVSDVANAVYDSTSAVMLSGETAIGQYPIQAAAMMCDVVEEAEKDFPYREFFHRDSALDYRDVSYSLAFAAVKTAYSTGANAILAFTNSGFTARLIARFRPEMPIIALTASQKVYHQLSVSWGVIPADPAPSENAEKAFHIASCFALKRKLVEFGDLVVVTAGSPYGITGTTNMMIVESLGDVLVRGKGFEGRRIHGRVTLLLALEEKKKSQLKGSIAVLSRCDDTYLPFLKNTIGIILQNHSEDTDSEKHAEMVAKTLDIPLITRAEGALQLLKDGGLITLDPQKGIIYKGSWGNTEEMISSFCR